ncbi:MAG: acylphosphatase [Chlorobi bacterium]|nr:acylphosphatase [Chlorobiota bacterium]
MNDRAAARIVVHGRVQGVGFRMFAYRAAVELGLTGMVRNAEDGRTVIADVEGPRASIERFYDLCRQGPPHAVVERASIEWTEPSGRFHDFRIAR